MAAWYILQILKLTENVEQITTAQRLTKIEESVAENELKSIKEEILSLEEEKKILEQVLEDLLAERNRCLESQQLVIVISYLYFAPLWPLVEIFWEIWSTEMFFDV